MSTGSYPGWEQGGQEPLAPEAAGGSPWQAGVNSGRRGRGPARALSQSRALLGQMTNKGLIMALGVNHYTPQENQEGATWGDGHVGQGRAGLGGTWGQGRGCCCKQTAQNHCARALLPLKLGQRGSPGYRPRVPKVPLSLRLKNLPGLQETASTPSTGLEVA